MIFNPAWPYLRLPEDDQYIVGMDEASQVAADGDTAAWTPAQLSNKVLWYDAQSLSSLYQDSLFTTPVAANNDPVGGVRDLFGVGNDAIQATGANRLSYVTSGINGHPCLKATSSTLWLARTFAATINQPITILMVYQETSNASFRSFWDGIVATNSLRVTMFDNAPNRYISSGTGTALATTQGEDTNPHIVSAIFNGATSKCWFDGGPTKGSGDAGAGTPTGITIGNLVGHVNGMQGYIGEVIVLNEASSLATINQIGAYWATKWGLTWTTAS